LSLKKEENHIFMITISTHIEFRIRELYTTDRFTFISLSVLQFSRITFFIRYLYVGKYRQILIKYGK